MPLLTMRGIVKEFPGVRALDGVDLDVAVGEVHCLLGQNGAGKSTLIKVLGGAGRLPIRQFLTQRRVALANRSIQGLHLNAARPAQRPGGVHQLLEGEGEERFRPAAAGERGKGTGEGALRQVIADIRVVSGRFAVEVARQLGVGEILPRAALGAPSSVPLRSARGRQCLSPPLSLRPAGLSARVGGVPPRPCVRRPACGG